MLKIPKFLENKLKEQYNDIEKIVEGFSFKHTTIRVNNIKSNIDEVCKILDENNIGYKKVSWYSDALIIEDDKNLRNLDLYKNGYIYIQNLSSMIPPLVLEPCQFDSILDMTASPGSKTTQISSLTSNMARITAVEKNKIRADKLKYNIKMQGANRVTVLVEDARNLDDFYSFDKILLDAPCSGSGTLNEKNIENFNEELVNRSVKFQKELVNKAIKLLKKDGILVYSTCSILECENENIVNYILKNNMEIINIENFDEIPKLNTKIDGCLCVCPNEFFEGFFVAKFRKK